MFIRPLPLPLALVAFACLLIGISTADPANATTETMGETSVLPNADGDNAGFVTVQKATLSQSGTIESLSLYTPVAAGSVILGIYNASGTGGGPGTLLATTNSFTPVSGWSTANVTSPVTLAAGTYWLAYEPSSNTLSFTKNSIGNSEWMTYSSFGALPSTFGTVAGSGTSIWSFYATLNVSSAVSGSCGSANGTSGSSAPTTLCTAGTASSVSGTGPWTWSCAGSGGGSTASCSESKSSTGGGSSSTTETMGETSVLPNADGGNAGFVTVQKATLSQSGTIESLSLYTPVAAGSVILGIYNASGTGGGPGTLLATTNSFTAVSGWNTANVQSPVTLAAGTYWLAYEPSSNTLSFTKNSIGNSEWMTYSSFGALPATFGTVAGSGTSVWSFYATLNVSSNVSSAVSGSCGSANSTSGSSAPTTNLCTAGTASSVSGTGPWTWSCAGSGGGSTASCSAPVTSISGTTTTINWGSTYQTISGWGASTGYNEINPNITAAQADCFFSTSNGSCATGNSIGLGWIRIQDNSVANSTPDAATVLLAQARGAKVELGFNNPSSLQSNYAGIAAYDVAKIQYWQRQGVTINAISPVNEPQNTGTTAAAIDTFVASYLWPAMNAAGFGAIPLTLPESANWFATDYVTPCMNDSNCKSHVVAVSGHAYYYGGGVQAGSSGVDGFSTLGDYANCCVDYAANLPPSSAAGLPIWETEVNGGASGPCDGSLATYDSSMSPDALVWAHNIHDFLTVQNGTQWQYWNLESGYGCNDGLTDRSFNPAKRFYAIGNWSRFVQPGWLRIGATANPTSGVYVTAFKGGTTVGSFAIVVINENASSVTMNFSLDGFTSPSVTPYVTSAGSDLAEQSAISVTGDVITTTLGAESVTTFVGTGEE